MMREIKICMNEDRYKIKQITNNIFGLCIVPWTRNVFRTTVLHFPGMEKGKLNFAHKRNVCSKNTLWDEALERNKADKGGKRRNGVETGRREKRKRKREKKEKERTSLFSPSHSFFFFFLLLLLFHRPLSLTLFFHSPSKQKLLPIVKIEKKSPRRFR